MTELRDLLDFDPTLKNADWINRMVTNYRMSWQPLVDVDRVRKALRYLYGVQDMTQVKAMFADPEKAGIKFMPLAVLEKIRNILASEIIEGGVQVHVKATDPTAFNQSQRDRDLLTNRKIIETVISKEQMSIGGPSYSLSDDKAEDGSPVFNGNVKDFDEMGLDEDSSEDVGYFFAFWHRLNHEIKAEEPINTFLKDSEVIESLEQMVDDVLSAKAVAYRTYVSDTTGAIEHKYLSPLKVRHIAGTRKTGKDDLCKGYEDELTVGEFLRLVGSEFNPDIHMTYVLNAINYSTGAGYTGINYLQQGVDIMLCGDRTGNLLSYNDAAYLKIKMGYIEFKSQDAVAYKITKKNAKNYHGNVSARKIDLTKKVDEHSTYRKEVYFNEVVYKAYFLATTSSTQCVFKAGRLNWQQVEGADDEIASYTISTFVQSGPTFIEAVAPMVDMFVKAFYKMEFAVNKYKLPGRAYSYDSLVQIAQHLYPEDAKASRFQGIMKVVKLFAETPNEIYTYPEIDGQTIGGGSMSSHEVPSHILDAAKELRGVMEMCDQLIDRMLGISPQRSVYAPKPREVGGLQDSVTVYSDKATDYMPRMINTVLVNMGNTTLKFVQDILAFGGKTLAYRHLLARLGDQTIDDLKQLQKVSLHRYSIFVEFLNMAQERQEVKMFTIQAQANKEITAAQAVLISSIRSPKRAAQMLAFEKERTSRQNAKIQQAANDFAMQMKDKDLQGQIKLQELKNYGLNMERDTAGRWLYESYKISHASDIQRMEMKIDADTDKIRQKTELDIEKQQAEAGIQQQQAAPVTA